MKNLFLIIVTLFASVSFVMAQGIDFPSEPPADTNGPDPIPVDGGAVALLAAGSAYAMKRLKAVKAKKVNLSA